jgi:hypothetical protein
MAVYGLIFNLLIKGGLVYKRLSFNIIIDNTFIIKTNLRMVFDLFLISKFVLKLKHIKNCLPE